MPTGLTDLLSLTSHRKVSPWWTPGRWGLSDGGPLPFDVLFGTLGHPSLKSLGEKSQEFRRNP